MCIGENETPPATAFTHLTCLHYGHTSTRCCIPLPYRYRRTNVRPGETKAFSPRRSGVERKRCARRCRWSRLLPPSSFQESDETHRLLAGPVPLNASRIFCTSSWRLRSFLPAIPRAVAASHACAGGMPARSRRVSSLSCGDQPPPQPRVAARRRKQPQPSASPSAPFSLHSGPPR